MRLMDQLYANGIAAPQAAPEREIKVGDQVEVRRKIRSGMQVRIGNVVRIDAAKMATVRVAAELNTLVVPVSELILTSTRFGNNVARRSLDPRGTTIFR